MTELLRATTKGDATVVTKAARIKRDGYIKDRDWFPDYLSIILLIRIMYIFHGERIFIHVLR